MKVSIVTGSHRTASQSGKVARFIEELVKQDLASGFDSIYSLDLGNKPLPLWDEDIQKPDVTDTHWKAGWAEISAQFHQSHAFVLVTPEWSGMVPAAMKNLLLLCGNNELMHKPALIVSVSSGMGGTYPVAELRANSPKDTKICYIPEPVIIRQVQHLLNDAEPRNEYDVSIRERLKYSLALLREYAKALTAVRESGVVDVRRFPYGM